MPGQKRSITLHGHRTSVSLEVEFWDVIDAHIDVTDQSLAGFIAASDDQRILEKSRHGLASYLRVWVVRQLKAQLAP